MPPKISYWDLVTNKCLSMFNDVHPPGFGVLNVKVTKQAKEVKFVFFIRDNLIFLHSSQTILTVCSSVTLEDMCLR